MDEYTFDMKLNSLEELLPKEDPIKFPITVQFSKAEEQRWCAIRDRLKRINPRLRIAYYARYTLNEMMDTLERLIEERETKAPVTDHGGLLTAGNGNNESVKRSG